MSFLALKLLTARKRRHLPLAVIYEFPSEIKIKNFTDIYFRLKFSEKFVPAQNAKQCYCNLKYGQIHKIWTWGC